MNILITGGAGYIGSVLVPRLLQDDHCVRVADLLIYGPGGLVPCIGHPRFEFVRTDARYAMKRHVAWADVLIPLAAVVGFPACKDRPDQAETSNRDAVLMLNELRSDSQLFIFPNSNSGYGVGEENELCTEASAMQPLSLYGCLKVETEQRLFESGKKVTSFRFATAFGVSPRMRLDLLVNDFVMRAYWHGELVVYEPHFQRNFVHVRDIADAFAKAIAWRDRISGPINFGNDKLNMTKLELAELVAKLMPHPVGITIGPGKDPDQRNYRVSNAHAHDLQLVAGTGIAETIEKELVFCAEMLRTVWDQPGPGPYRNA